MKLRSLKVLGFTTLFGIAVPFTAFANNEKGGEHGDMFKKMDANGDGKISAEEHTAGAKKMFEMMDANKDGKVTAEEMTAAHGKMHGDKKPVAGKDDKSEMTAAEKIKTIDTDGDGAITAAEHEAGAKSMFTQMDTDKDGFLTQAEMATGHKAMMKSDKSTEKPATK